MLRVGAVTVGLGVLGCDRGPAQRASEAPPAVGTTETTSAELEQWEPRETPAPVPGERREETAPAGLVEVPVAGEPTSFVLGVPPGSLPRLVYLHGMCSGPEGMLQSFEGAARAHGGVLGLTGDKSCPDGQHAFTVDATRQQRRLEKTLAGLATAGDGALPEVLIGYSQGASVAERLAAAHPYPFVVLIGSPREPSPANLANVRAVVLVSGEKDMARPKMKAARAACEAAGIPAHYIEMPGARHGELPDGDAVIDEALTWMREHARGA